MSNRIIIIFFKSCNCSYYVMSTKERYNCSLKLYSYTEIDIDECNSTKTNLCDLNALCANTEGSYACRCLKGYEGDGTNCTGQ